MMKCTCCENELIKSMAVYSETKMKKHIVHCTEVYTCPICYTRNVVNWIENRKNKK